MDESQTAFAPQYYGFDLDMMKRSMDTVGGPDAKKARWSPNTFSANSAAASRDAFANYGYGPQASISQQQQQQAVQQQQQQQQQQSVFGNASSSPVGGFAGSPLYSTPQLSINTQSVVNGSGGAGGQLMSSQASPNLTSATALFMQQQQQAGAQGAQGGQGVQGQAGQHSPLNGNAAFGGFGAYNLLNMGIPGMNMLGAFPYNNQMAAANFAQQRIPSLNLSIPTAQSPYSPAALTAALSASSNSTGRTVYIGNLPPSASVDELLNLVHFGPLESIRVLPEKSCVFLSFLDGATAAAFHADATIKKLSLHGQELKIGWGKPSPVPAQVALAISQSNASRNVYLGGLDETMTEEALRDDLSRFGLIDQVKIVRDKNIGFVHFLSISVATKVVNTLPTEPNWAGKRVNYGKDRCAYVPKSQQVAAQQAQAAAAQSLVAAQQQHQQHQQQMGHAGMGMGMSPTSASPQNGFNNGGGQPFSPFSPYGAASPFGVNAAGGDATGAALQAMAGMGVGVGMAAAAQGLNRTVYLGNIHPETTTEDLCNSIRGGVLQSIRYMQDKHIAFVTFVDPAAAFTFFQVASYQGLTLNNRRLKIGWGKNSGPLPPTLALAVHSGATRNVYIGNIEDFELWNEERLKRDFGEYGEVELVNYLKEKNCAFVNFTNVSNAIKSIEGIKNKPEYSNLRIAHGKDRCANPPRSGPQGGGQQGGGGGGGMRRSASNNHSGHGGQHGGGQEQMESDAVYLGGDMEDVDGESVGEYGGSGDVKKEEGEEGDEQHHQQQEASPEADVVKAEA